MPSTDSAKRRAHKRKMSDLFEVEPTRRLLQLWSELPVWQQEDNRFIQSGYRPASGSYRHSLQSWSYLHNETINIFSHLVGSILFFLLPIYVYRELRPRYGTATTADLVVFSAYLFGVAVCFAFSAAFHTVMNHSAEAFAWGIQLDFQGVLILMWGATVPIIYYAFICLPKLQKVYWVLISLLAVACSVFTFTPAFKTQSRFIRPMRAALFGGFALSAIVPIIHSIALWGWEAQNYRISLGYILGVMCFNTAGAVAYATKFPERWFPRRFDLVGGSHQIMHILVLCAALVHVFGLVRNFDHLHRDPLPCR